MKVLLVYQQIPEETYFVVMDATGDDLAILDAAQGSYVNSDDLTEAQKQAHYQINENLTSGKYPSRGAQGKWYQYVVPEVAGQAYAGPFERVYTLGFYL